MSFGQEIMQGMRVGTQSAEVTLFWQFDGDSGNGSVWDLACSCSSLVRMIRECLQYLLKVTNAEMKVLWCYDTFLHT